MLIYIIFYTYCIELAPCGGTTSDAALLPYSLDSSKNDRYRRETQNLIRHQCDVFHQNFRKIHRETYDKMAC